MAMREAASAAWEQDWPAAIRAYQKALEVVPNDAQALAGLALGLYEAGDDKRALRAYAQLARLVPSDPLPREKLAEIYKREGQTEDSAKQFMTAGEIYFARKDMRRAIEKWEQAVRTNIDLAQAHMRLAVTYEQTEATRPDAVLEYLHVARLLQRMGQVVRAEQALRRALSIDPINADIRNALDDVRRNQRIQAPEFYPEKAASAEKKMSVQSAEDLPTEEEELLEAAEEVHRYNPIEEAVRYAMGQLADSIWSGGLPPEAMGPLLAAIDAHQLGNVEAATEGYLQAQSLGLDNGALSFNLGVLYHYQRNFHKAVHLLQEVAEQSDYALAGNLLLGEAYFAEDQRVESARRLVMALRTADRELNTGPVDEDGYEYTLTHLSSRPEDAVADLAKTISVYLNEDEWRAKLLKALTNYREQGKINYVPDLLELMIEGGRPELAAIMDRVDTYIQRNMLHMAIEEIYYAIERVPDYLPAHRRLADTLVREGRTQEAAAKINLVANTYMVRGNANKAADLFAEVIDLWPADTGARRRVIGMLREQHRSAEAIKHYVELADTYYRLMADPDQAIDVYRQALNYSREVNAAPEQIVPVLRGLADIESQRLNWRRALQYYEQISGIVPDDEDVALTVIDLHFQLDNSHEAIRALDEYIRYCIRSGRVNRVTEVLEAQVHHRPQEIPLRQRLAEVYRQQGRKQEAIAQLDALGELQLDATLINNAVATIQKIISMDPPDVEGYRSLLAQLKSGGYQQ